MRRPVRPGCVRHATVPLLVSIALTLLAGAAPAAPKPTPAGPGDAASPAYVEGEVLVKLRPGAADVLIDNVKATRALRVHEGKVAWWNGEGPRGVDANGDPLGISDYVAAMVKDRPLLRVESTGSGAHESSGRASTGQNKLSSQMSNAEKDAFVKQNGIKAWQDKLAGEFRQGKLKGDTRGIVGVGS